VLRDSKFSSIESGDIRVGDIVKVVQNDMVPADMLFLSSALSKGHCFIDKSNLNGETTLEVMNSIVITRQACKEEADIAKSKFHLTFEPPNKRFDSFRGHMKIANAQGAEQGQTNKLTNT
jgi:phospholipid-translocating ATPase